MVQVSVQINARKYTISCDDGQEAHLTRLASYVDRRVSELVASVGQIGDTQLLVMAGLLIADELSDAYSELKLLRHATKGKTTGVQAGKDLAQRLETFADRIESVAEVLKHP